ncbi:MAG: helix-turn-helix domain-containing protein [Clostridia bacterium]|nr:helix-turn-helix domain-containing protein [Clostridia bacterium]
MAQMPTEFVKFHFDNWFVDDPMHIAPFTVYQVGEIDTYPGFELANHQNNQHELTYIVKGTAQITCGDTVYDCKAGDIIYNAKGDTHAIKNAESQSLRYYFLSFGIDDTSSRAEKILSDFFDTIGSGKTIADKAIPNAFQDIFINLYDEDELSKALIVDSIRKILIFTHRSFEGKANRVYIPDVRFGKKRIISQICSFIDSNVEDISTLKKLPEKFGYSYSYLSSFFSKSMGISLKNYFLLSRHRYECDLLKSGLSVTEVAERMGYSSIHAFSNAFSAREGISPSVYADKRKKK